MKRYIRSSEDSDFAKIDYAYYVNSWKQKRLIHMSFYDGSLDRDVARSIIRDTRKWILYTDGLTIRKPTTYMQRIGKDDALKLIDNKSFIDFDEYETYIHINTYSSNDMW